MLNIRFYPDSDNDTLIKNALEYQSIFEDQGERLINKLEEKTGFSFVEGHINAVVCRYPSDSFPLTVTQSKTTDSKITTLMHELSRRLLAPIEMRMWKKNVLGIEVQRLILICLVLYDSFIELYGEEFAERCIKRESTEYGEKYEKAWSYVSGLSKSERQEKYLEMIKKYKTA